MLLRGITLSADQQKRVEALREQERNEMRARHEQLRGSADEARAPRQRPDSATMRQMRARHEQERERRVSALRNILSADQRRTFDANLAELRQREAQRDSVHRSGDGGRDGRRGEPGASRPQ